MIDYAGRDVKHVHRCRQWDESGNCDIPCVCACGAVLRMKSMGLWAWQLLDGNWAPFAPDPIPDDPA